MQKQSGIQTIVFLLVCGTAGALGFVVGEVRRQDIVREAMERDFARKLRNRETGEEELVWVGFDDSGCQNWDLTLARRTQYEATPLRQ